jgi:hypothetical protein
MNATENILSSRDVTEDESTVFFRSFRKTVDGREAISGGEFGVRNQFHKIT